MLLAAVPAWKLRELAPKWNESPVFFPRAEFESRDTVAFMMPASPWGAEIWLAREVVLPGQFTGQRVPHSHQDFLNPRALPPGMTVQHFCSLPATSSECMTLIRVEPSTKGEELVIRVGASVHQIPLPLSVSHEARQAAWSFSSSWLYRVAVEPRDATGGQALTVTFLPSPRSIESQE
jgi:hypothetical protein